MTNDEAEWLSDFLETAQASARQSLTTAEKDYGIKLRLFTPRFARAHAYDAEESLAKRLAAGEALAGQRKFDAASDALDEAFVIAGEILRNAAPAVEEKAPAIEPESVEEIAGETVAEGAAAAAAEALIEEPAHETAVEEPAAEAPVEEPVVEVPVEELAVDAPLEELAVEAPTEEPAVEELAVDAPVEELSVDAPVEEPAAEYVVEEPAGEMVTEAPAGETTTDESVPGSDLEALTAEYVPENPEETAQESAEAAPADEGLALDPEDPSALPVAPDAEAVFTGDAPAATENYEAYVEGEAPAVQEEESGAGSPPPEEPAQPKKRGRS